MPNNTAKSEFELKKREFAKKKRHKRAKRNLTVFAFLFVCIGIILTVLKAPFFNIETVVCVGQQELTEEEIIKIAEVKVGANIFSSSVKGMKKRLADNPSIEECNVRRLFPNKIKIWVRESKAVLFLETESGFLLMDKQGQIIKILPKESIDETAGIAKLLDFEPTVQTLGERMFSETEPREQIILRCIELLSKLEMIDHITTISASDLSDIRIDYQDRLYIMLGSYENLEYKLNFVKKVISESISEYEKALLDYRGKNLYVGPREDQNAEQQSNDPKANDAEKTEDETQPDAESPDDSLPKEEEPQAANIGENEQKTQ